MVETTREERDEWRSIHSIYVDTRDLNRAADISIDEMWRLCNDADLLDHIKHRIKELADTLNYEAYSAVPSEYADRSLHYKYLKSNSEASGLYEASLRLYDLLNTLNGRIRES